MEVFPSLTVKADSATPYTDATQVSGICLKILQKVDFKFHIHDQIGLRGFYIFNGGKLFKTVRIS